MKKVYGWCMLTEDADEHIKGFIGTMKILLNIYLNVVIYETETGPYVDFIRNASI